jgi:succinate--hydroxymethylglutarate CoA-transferase
LCRVLGKPELADDERFSTPQRRAAHMMELSSIFEPVFASKPADEWTDALDKAGVMNSRLNRFRDLFEHPQVIENRMIAEHESVDVGPLKQLGHVVDLSETPGVFRRAAPALGQHNDEVLGELGYSAEEIVRLREDGVIK